MKNFKILLLIFPLLFLAGCFDKQEPEQQAYVMAVGLDAMEEKGKLRVTFQIGNPEATSLMGTGGNEPPYETVTLTANDFMSAKNTANSFVARRITLDHVKVLIVSEELARSDDFIRVIQSILRSKELRRNVQLVVSKEPASEFINNNKPKLETRPHKFFQFIINRARETGIIPYSDLHRFLQITEGDADLFLAIYATSDPENQINDGLEDEFLAGEIPQEGGNQTQFMGSAVFKEGIMIDKINGELTRLSMWLDNTFRVEDFMVTYPDPNQQDFRITARVIKPDRTKVDVKYRPKGTAVIRAEIPMDVEILAVPSMTDYSSDRKKQKKLKEHIETNLEKTAAAFIEKTQKEYKGEPFYWSLYVRKHFKTISEYEKADWMNNIYPNADVKVEFTINSLTFGKTVKESNLNEIRD
ncbi:Ger(x)C family spore germination protein [Bacillus marinisedimentorum]|uniref:Ger(x)C family spore germination protein n=1 Tax=Bacillus marinisedimentorum TaxID=1821260 RepID=UPI00087334AA|nr:Ger(x)C family spore germination protein [Bacillus marinisedimentorum]